MMRELKEKEITFGDDETVRDTGETNADDLLSMDDIESADDVDYRVVEVKGWGKVRLGSLSAGDLIDYNEANNGPAKKSAGVRLVMLSLVDKNGKRLARNADLERFKGKNAVRIGELVDHVLALNKLVKKEAPKNDSSEAPTSASPTD